MNSPPTAEQERAAIRRIAAIDPQKRLNYTAAELDNFCDRFAASRLSRAEAVIAEITEGCRTRDWFRVQDALGAWGNAAPAQAEDHSFQAIDLEFEDTRISPQGGAMTARPSQAALAILHKVRTTRGRAAFVYSDKEILDEIDRFAASRLAEAERALRKYGQHTVECRAYRSHLDGRVKGGYRDLRDPFSYTEECNCGFDAALAAYRVAAGSMDPSRQKS